MRIITMRQLTESGQKIDPRYESDHDDWFCVIETKEEEIVYEDFLKNLGEYDGDCRDILWNKLVIYAGQGMGVSWGDDDMYGYIRPDEGVPDIGEEWEDWDGDKWVRIE